MAGGPAGLRRSVRERVDGSEGGSVSFLDVEVGGKPVQRVDVVGGVVTRVVAADGWPGRRAVVTGPVPPGEVEVVDGRGGALLPGLHDHHLHLLSWAARHGSVGCGPPEVRDAATLAGVLRKAAAGCGPGEWVRGAGYDESVAGPLDTRVLADLMGDLGERPVRVQDRSGHRWVLNEAGLARLGSGAEPGTGWGAGSRPTLGVFVDSDAELSRSWPAVPVDLGRVGSELAATGCTGVTDATAGAGRAERALIESAQSAGELPQAVCMLGGAVPGTKAARLWPGPVKIVLHDAALPAMSDLLAEIAGAGGRGVALHCASRQSTVLGAAALRDSAGFPGDAGVNRIEHASVADPSGVSLVASARARVVTQPGFVAAHGDRYLAEVEVGDRPWLYRLRGWLEAGVPLAAGSDGPFGPTDPWLAMRAAVSRSTAAGQVVGCRERLTPEQALALFLSPLDRPGDPPRRVVPGAAGDLCLLHVPWAVARAELDRSLVRATYCVGRPVYGVE